LYCVEEIGPYIEKLQPPEFAPQWDNSKALLNAANEAMLSRMWAHIIVIMIPTILALALNYNHALNSAFPFGPLWWLCLLAVIIIILIIIRADSTRKEYYKKYNFLQINANQLKWIEVGSPSSMVLDPVASTYADFRPTLPSTD